MNDARTLSAVSSRTASLGAPSPDADDLIVAGTRLFLAASALLIVFLIPSEPDRWVRLTYTVLVSQTIYAAALYLLRFFRTRVGRFIYDWGHWIDVAWYTALITLSSGTNSIFFFGYFFPILVASFRWGFASGMRVAVASAMLFAGCGWIARPPAPGIETQRFFFRPFVQIGLGYMVASRGRLELKLRERLRFLKDVAAVANPRLGTDRMFGAFMHGLLRHFGADRCTIVLDDPAAGRCDLRRARRSDPDDRVPSEPIPRDLAADFLELPDDLSVAYSGEGATTCWRGGIACPEREVPLQTIERAAAILEARSFLSVPIVLRGRSTGRVFLESSERTAASEPDAAFLTQAVEHAFPLIENILLVDRLAASAAHEERQRIARDLHDSVIQPYIGLHMGLTALSQRLAATGGEGSVEVDRLVKMASAGVDDLRSQVSSLRGGAWAGGAFLSAVSRFAARFADATGIAVDVEAPSDIVLDDRLAGEAFQMVAEGLSNVRRHTRAERVRVSCDRRNGHLRLSIDNEGARDEAFLPFSPRTISERAQGLGGRVTVEERPEGGTSVVVEIPLEGRTEA
jgi:signal transduction histidine kinase